MDWDSKTVFQDYLENLPRYVWENYYNNSPVSSDSKRIYIFNKALGGMIILNSNGTWVGDIAPWAG